MLKNRFKHFLKNSVLIHKLSVAILFIYLKLVYMTSRWEFVFPEELDSKKINKLDGALFALWHNRLAFGMHIFKKYDHVYALASTHTDGRLITDVIRAMRFGVIEGSTNRHAADAVRSIIKGLSSGHKIVITPDGPRGPVYKINSSITKIAYKYEKTLIPFSCSASKYKELKSWDKMVIPKLFGKIIVVFGAPIKLSGDETKDNKLLEKTLNDLSSLAKQKLNEASR